MINHKQIIKDFPILTASQNGSVLSYLDSANTSLTPETVLEAMNLYYREYNANIHRGIYPLSEKATAMHEDARQKAADFIKASTPKEIIFTRNATEALNLVALTWGNENLQEGDTVVLSIMEHHSNIVPWQLLQKGIPFNIKYLGVDQEGRLNLEELKDLLKEGNVKMVSITYQSNTLGTINPIKDISKLVHAQGALMMVDACQAVPHMSVDVQDLDADFLIFTGHKICGPTGIGVLYGKEALLEKMNPFLGGGEMIRTVTTEGSTWNDLPYKFEAGTPNIAGAIGLGAAIDYLNSLGMESIQDREKELLEYALASFKNIEGLKIYGPKDSQDRGAVISFELSGIHPHDLATLLGEDNICIRAGNHCAQPLMEELGVAATSRVSLSFYNTETDIDRAVTAIKKAQQLFQ
jgi:cysteine desulfurase/selenocysteine lyase